MTAGRMWGRLGLLLLVALICSGGVSAATASPLGHVGPGARAGHPPMPDPTAAARYLAAQRAGFGSPAHAARLAANAAVQAQTIRARPIPRVAGAASLSAAWTALGPSPVTSSFYGSQNTGRVDSVAVVPSGTNRGEIFIGTAGGGVWSSTDNGVTWQTHTDHVSTGLAIGALAIDPSSPATIYAGTGEANNCGDCFYGGGVLKSTDGGQTWTTQNPGGVFTGVDFASIAVDPRNGQHLYAGTSNGLYVSTDGGASWAHPAGDTSTQPVHGLALDPTTNPTTMFVATRSTGVQKSTDAGASFTTLAGGLPAAANFGDTTLGIGTPSSAHPNANQTLYAAVQLNGTTDLNGGGLSMYKSTDGGTSWTRQPIPAYTNQSYAYGSGTADQAWYDNAIAVDPANPSHVIAAGIAVVESTDGGATWSNVNGQSYFAGGTNVVHPDFHALTFASASEAIFGCDGGVYAYNPTTPGPAGVTSLNSNQNTTQLYEDLSVYNNGAQVLGGLQDNGTALYSGAAAWPSVNSGDGGYNAINPLDANQQFSEADQGLYETTNTWGTSTNITPPLEPQPNTNFVPPMVIVPNSAAVDSPTVFYGGEDLYVTHNPTAAPPSWTKLTSVGSGVSAIAVAPSNPAVMYIGFDNGTLEVSTNATAVTPTFTAISPGVGQWITHIDVSPSNPGSIAVSFSRSNTHYFSVAPMVETGAVTLTGSPAATYTNITGNLPTGVASNSVVFDTGSLVVATDVGVFSTSSPNGASTVWTAVGTGLPNVQVIGLTVAGNGDLYAATHGRGVWKLNVSGTAPPTVSGISPTSGPAAGGTSVTITGTNLAGATAVNFGSNPATTFTVNSATSITATSPAGSGTVDVTVTTPAGTSAAGAGDRFTYLLAEPGTPMAQVTGSGAFGTQLVGTTSASHDLTVTNTGSAALSVPPGGVTLSGADAGQYVLTGDSCSGRQVAPSSACTVQVAFAPSTRGIHAAASVLVSDNAAGSPQSVALSGTAIQPSPGPHAPAISHLQQSHRRWRLGNALPKLISRVPGKTLRGKAPLGTVFTFGLTVGARVTVSFAEQLTHRRTRPRGSFTLSGHAGIDRIAFAGRLSRRQKLAPGNYTVTLVATNSAGHSTAVQLAFTIVR